MVGENELHIFFVIQAKSICKISGNPWQVRINYIYSMQNKSNIYVKFFQTHSK